MRGASTLEFNYAHDYIINDMLRHALGVDAIPAGGLDMPGAREKSAEEIVVEMRRLGHFSRSRSHVWEGTVASVEQVKRIELRLVPALIGHSTSCRRKKGAPRRWVLATCSGAWMWRTPSA